MNTEKEKFKGDRLAGFREMKAIYLKVARPGVKAIGGAVKFGMIQTLRRRERGGGEELGVENGQRKFSTPNMQASSNSTRQQTVPERQRSILLIQAVGETYGSLLKPAVAAFDWIFIHTNVRRSPLIFSTRSFETGEGKGQNERGGGKPGTNEALGLHILIHT
jgi:hypothetical protein